MFNFVSQFFVLFSLSKLHLHFFVPGISWVGAVSEKNRKCSIKDDITRSSLNIIMIAWWARTNNIVTLTLQIQIV